MNQRHLAMSCLIASGLILSANLSAADLGEGLINESSSIILKNTSKNYTHFNGIGKIILNDFTSCNATLLDTRDSDNKTTGPAYVLTTARCAIRYVPHESDFPRETIKFNYFNDTLDVAKSFPIKKTVWYDIRNTNLAIMELRVSLGSLLEEGITPLKLKSAPSKGTTNVVIAGTPENAPEPGLRLAACTQLPVDGALVQTTTTYQGTFRNHCQGFSALAAGSPILERSTGQIIGVLAASTHDSTIDEQCFDDSPCEVKNGKPVWTSDTSYSQPVDKLSSCFKMGIFDSTASACAPPVKNQLTHREYVPAIYIAMPRGKPAPNPIIEAEFSLSTPYYRFKTVRDITQCKSAASYSGIFNATNANLKAPLNKRTGIHYLCVIGVESAEQKLTIEWMQQVWASRTMVVKNKTVKTPEFTITIDAESNHTIDWKLYLPTRSHSFYYAGSVDTDCSAIKPENFTETLEPLTIKAGQLPMMLCSKNADLANNISNVRSDLIKLP